MGVGTRLGNGCTSGHSVCGIPRLSLRSIVATCTFISFAMLIATLRYNYPFLNSDSLHYFSDPYVLDWKYFCLGLLLTGLLFIAYLLFKARKSRSGVFELLITYLLGVIFGLGLMIGGMLRVSKISGFLIIDKERWDPSLMFVMASALSINFVTF